MREEGVQAFYSGLQAVLMSLGVSNFVYFYANNLFKVLIKNATQKEITIVQNLFIASLAGVVNVMLTCPLWVANTRLRLQSGKGGHGGKGGSFSPEANRAPYKNLLDAVVRIGREEGVTALWNGAQASLVLVSNPTIHFVVYDKVIAVMQKSALAVGRKRLTSWEIFWAGAIAKTAATIITYPIQLAQSRLRAVSSTPAHKSGATQSPPPPQQSGEAGATTNNAQGSNGSGRPKSLESYKNTLDVLIKVFKKDGILGWFAGLNVKVIQTVLTAAFQFLCYEYIKDFIFAVLRPKKTGKSFGGGA